MIEKEFKPTAAYAAGIRAEAQDVNEGRERHAQLYHRRCWNCGRDVHVSKLEDGWCASCRGEVAENKAQQRAYVQLGHHNTARMLRAMAAADPTRAPMFLERAAVHERLAKG